MKKGSLFLSAVVLGTRRLDLTTRPTVTGKVLACSSCNAGREQKMVNR